jgi:hypothetical protein
MALVFFFLALSNRGGWNFFLDYLSCLFSSGTVPGMEIQNWNTGLIVKSDRFYPRGLNNVPSLSQGLGIFSIIAIPCLTGFSILFFFFYYSYVHTMLGSFLPHALTPSLTTHSAPSLSPQPPQYPADTIFQFLIKSWYLVHGLPLFFLFLFHAQGLW